MFILQMAHVPRFFSCPKRLRFLELPPFRSIYFAHSMSMPPEPQVGSWIRIPSVGARRETISSTTFLGV